MRKKKIASGVAALRSKLRAADKAKLAELRSKIAAARAAKKSKVAAVRAMCRGERKRLAAERVALRSSCPLAAMVASRAGDDAIAKATRELVEARTGLRDSSKGGVRRGRVELRPIAKKRGESRTRAATVADSWVKRREKDEFVEREIPRELVPVWRKVRGQIKSTPRMSRTEAFLEWVHNNSADVASMLTRHDENIGRWVAEEKTLREKMSRSRYRKCAAGTVCALAEYPAADFQD